MKLKIKGTLQGLPFDVEIEPDEELIALYFFLNYDDPIEVLKSFLADVGDNK